MTNQCECRRFLSCMFNFISLFKMEFRFKLDFLKYTDYCMRLEASRKEIALIEQTKPNVNKIVEVSIY